MEDPKSQDEPYRQSVAALRRSLIGLALSLVSLAVALWAKFGG